MLDMVSFISPFLMVYRCAHTVCTYNTCLFLFHSNVYKFHVYHIRVYTMFCCDMQMSSRKARNERMGSWVGWRLVMCCYPWYQLRRIQPVRLL